MGFNPFKAIKKVFKSVAKGTKNIMKGAGRAFESGLQAVKRFAKSDLGKAVMIGAAIYFTAGALTAAAAPTSTALSAELAATTIPSGAAALPGSAASVLGGPGAGLASTGAAATAIPSGAAAAKPGLLSMIKTGAAKNPGLVMMGSGQILSALTAPAPTDPLALEQWKREHSNIAGVDYSGTGTPLGSRSSPGLVRQAMKTARRTESTIQQRAG